MLKIKILDLWDKRLTKICSDVFWILNYWMNSLCLCSAVDRLTVTALLSLKFIDHFTSYKITWYFLCQIATDRRIQLQNKYLNKYLKVLRRFLFIHRWSTGQPGFLRNFRKLMKEAKCIGKNLILFSDTISRFSVAYP